METSPQSSSKLIALGRIAAVLLLLFIFLVGIKGLGSGFKLMGKDLLSAFFAATSNPFVALFVGILATTLVQSSSVTTSMIVGLVAAPKNPLPVANAVPMVMGANIGTTVTNTIVSLAHLGRRGEFKQAFAVATCHDFFNFFAVLILLPAELLTGFLSRTAATVAVALSGLGGVTFQSPLKSALKVGVAPLEGLAKWLFEVKTGQAVVLILVSGTLIVIALFMIVRLLRSAMRTRVQGYLTRALDKNAVVLMLVGAIMTVMVQSSSITTSLLVPLAGAGLLTVDRAFPVTLGANVGTTITALLASLAVSGPNGTSGVTIALVHLMFNLGGILLIYPVPMLRQIPLRAAERMSEVAARSPKWALLYTAGLFYLLPGLLVLLQKALG